MRLSLEQPRVPGRPCCEKGVMDLFQADVVPAAMVAEQHDDRIGMALDYLVDRREHSSIDGRELLVHLAGPLFNRHAELARFDVEDVATRPAVGDPSRVEEGRMRCEHVRERPRGVRSDHQTQRSLEVRSKAVRHEIRRPVARQRSDKRRAEKANLEVVHAASRELLAASHDHVARGRIDGHEPGRQLERRPHRLLLGIRSRLVRDAIGGSRRSSPAACDESNGGRMWHRGSGRTPGLPAGR